MKSFLLTATLAIAVCLGAWSAGSASSARTLKPPAGAVPATLFGMHIHHLIAGAPQPTPWPSVSFGTWRLWDAGVDWASLEPQKGKWSFATLDKYVALAQEHHVEILLTLALTPTWASSRPTERSSYSPGNAAVPVNLRYWENYVRTVAARYKGRVHEYEIWNEPNLTRFYTGSIPEMVQLAKVAYQTLKAVDPTNTVSSPPATGASGLGWFDQYLKAGGGKYADVIGYHFYVNPAPPEEMVPLIQQVEQIMRNDGVGNKPLWDTETGWAIQNNEGTVKPSPGHGFNSVVLPENEAAAYVARTYILAWASGVSRLYWYAWDNGVMGLVEPDGKTLKAPGIAYGQVENWLVGATMTSCDSNTNGIWTCALTRPGNYRAWIMWNPNGNSSYALPKSVSATRFQNLNGRTYPVTKDRKIEIGPSPLLLFQPAT